MLRVTVEIVPFGNEKEAYVIERMLLANTGTNVNDIAKYSFVMTSRGVDWAGTIDGFARKNGAWTLIKTALTNADTLQTYTDEDIDDLYLTQASLADRLNSYKEKKK